MCPDLSRFLSLSIVTPGNSAKLSAVTLSVDSIFYLFGIRLRTQVSVFRAAVKTSISLGLKTSP